MPRCAQCKRSSVWHPNIPEFRPPLSLAWCRKTRLAVREQGSPPDSLQFSHPGEVLDSPPHISNSLWMSNPGISTKK